MATAIERTIEALGRMTVTQLREKYLEVFGEPSRSGNKDFLFKRVAWQVQSVAEGGLSERARRRAEELARDADIRTTIPKHMLAASGGGAVVTKSLKSAGRVAIPGTVLTRQYQGKLVQVTVLSKGFDYAGTVYKSLSSVAKAVTGTHWNGHLFFGLTTVTRKDPQQ